MGGVNSVEGEWPWQVSLHFSGHLYCGASVLSSDWLISAAHCFSKERRVPFIPHWQPLMSTELMNFRKMLSKKLIPKKNLKYNKTYTKGQLSIFSYSPMIRTLSGCRTLGPGAPTSAC